MSLRLPLSRAGTTAMFSSTAGSRPIRASKKSFWAGPGAVFIQCELGAHILPEGWNNWGNVSNEKTAFYAEYGSTGPGADMSERVRWSKKLNKKKAAAYTVEKVLAGDDGWNPLQ